METGTVRLAASIPRRAGAGRGNSRPLGSEPGHSRGVRRDGRGVIRPGGAHPGRSRRALHPSTLASCQTCSTASGPRRREWRSTPRSPIGGRSATGGRPSPVWLRQGGGYRRRRGLAHGAVPPLTGRRHPVPPRPAARPTRLMSAASSTALGFPCSATASIARPMRSVVVTASGKSRRMRGASGERIA